MKTEIIENLQALLVAVEAQPESQFNLSFFKQDADKTDGEVCGTLFCTVGLACTMPRFQALGFALKAYPMHWKPGSFSYFAEVNGVDVLGTKSSDAAFGANAYHELFEPAGDGSLDAELGYAIFNEYEETQTATHTHKQLAILRLKHRIATYGGEA